MRTLVVTLLGLLSGCAVTPSGPLVLVLPGTGKSFEEFHADEHVCRQAAQDDLQTDHAAPVERYGGLQRRYDNVYQQCMYAKGHRVPQAGRFTSATPLAYPSPYPSGRPPQ